MHAHTQHPLALLLDLFETPHHATLFNYILPVRCNPKLDMMICTTSNTCAQALASFQTRCLIDQKLQQAFSQEQTADQPNAMHLVHKTSMADEAIFHGAILREVLACSFLTLRSK